MTEIQTLCSILLSILTALYLYTGIYVIVGFFTARRFPKAKHQHRYGIVIAARNESGVIADLLASIRDQSYPGHLVTAFVVADNCTDSTADIARRCGAVVYERFDSDHRTKGYALQYLFEQIRRDYGIESFDGYIILDADNVLKQDYLEKMNNAFDSGEKIVASYRNTRNLGDGCLAASYAIHWMRTIRLEHRARSLFRLAGRLQGTGMLFSNELVRDGWNYTMLTEDRSFCADAVVKGYSISYQNEAEFYDEQPTSLRIAIRQRTRWAKGHLQAFACYGPKLFLHIFTAHGWKLKFMSLDMFLITLPQTLIRLILHGIQGLTGAAAWVLLTHGRFSAGSLKAAAITALSLILLDYLRQVIMAAYVLFMERSHLQQITLGQKIRYCLTFFLFDLIGILSVCIAVVTRVEWKPIPHHGSNREPAGLRRRTSRVA